MAFSRGEISETCGQEVSGEALLASGGHDGRIILWSTGSGRRLREMVNEFSKQPVVAIEFSTDAEVGVLGS